MTLSREQCALTPFCGFRCMGHRTQGNTELFQDGFSYHEVLVVEGDDAVYDPTYGLRTPKAPNKTVFESWRDARVGWLWSNSQGQWVDYHDFLDPLTFTPV